MSQDKLPESSTHTLRREGFVSTSLTLTMEITCYCHSSTPTFSLPLDYGFHLNYLYWSKSEIPKCHPWLMKRVFQGRKENFQGKLVPSMLVITNRKVFIVLFMFKAMKRKRYYKVLTRLNSVFLAIFGGF